MWRAGTARLLRALCCAALVAAASSGPLVYDSPVPAVVRVCVSVYVPFILERNWYGKPLQTISSPASFADPSSISGIVYRGVNTSLLDGFDIAFTKLLFGEYMGTAVEYYPYPDTSSLYVGLRNNECDVAAAAVELDTARATCTPSCPDPSVTPLQDLPGADYFVSEAYRDRLDHVCCLDYGIPHLPASGFALLSVAKTKGVSLVDAILSADVLNAATPIVISIIGFGWVMYAIEGRENNKQFHSQHAGVYYAFVSIATFGFGDVAPVTRAGRLLTIFWCILSVLSISALTSVVSARLTIDQLAYTTIDSLSQLRAADLCIESAYPLVQNYVSDEFSLEGDLEGGGVMLGTVQTCVQAVLAGDVKAYLTDRPLLQWLAFQYFDTGNLYVGPIIQTNPLTLAYPSGSPLLKLADPAVIALLTNTTWRIARERLESAWFPEGTVSSPGAASNVYVPTLVAAGVMVLAWIVGLVTAASRKALSSARGTHPLGRVVTLLRGRHTQGRNTGGEGATGVDDNGGIEAGAPAEPGGCEGKSPRIETTMD